MSSTNFSNTADIAARLRLQRHGREWRGACPSCGYADALVLTARAGRALWWCASCQDSPAVTAAIRAAMGQDWVPPAAQAKLHRNDTRSARALAIWDRAVPIRGTLAETYLDVRGLKAINSPALRYHPTLRHPNASGTYPAMIALVVNSATGEPMAVHRTYLQGDGTGKAGLEPAKASKGPIRAGAIMLDRPAAGRPLLIGEGIETSASAGLLLGVPAWAAVSAGNMEAIAPPREASEFLIAADPDAPGQRAADTAARRWAALGLRVRIITPPSPGTDFNDLLLVSQANGDRR